MDSYRVQDTEPARCDIFAILRYIAVELNEQAAALRMESAINNAIKGLSYMPHRYALVDDERLAALGYRKLNIKNYLAFFTIDEESKTVYVERVLYARRDWLHMI
jgi:plasmid stabilization system protein ParE